MAEDFEAASRLMLSAREICKALKIKKGVLLELLKDCPPDDAGSGRKPKLWDVRKILPVLREAFPDPEAQRKIQKLLTIEQISSGEEVRNQDDITEEPDYERLLRLGIDEMTAQKFLNAKKRQATDPPELSAAKFRASVWEARWRADRNEWKTVSFVAEALGCTPNTVFRLVQSGELRGDREVDDTLDLEDIDDAQGSRQELTIDPASVLEYMVRTRRSFFELIIPDPSPDEIAELIMTIRELKQRRKEALP